MTKINQIQSLSEIHSLYDCFFIDLWGVVHNGLKVFENVIDTLKFLREKKKEIFFLTNAPRRSSMIIKQFFFMNV